MKLTIKNFKKLVGGDLDGWVVEDVCEGPIFYSFLCRKLETGTVYGQINNVRLIRGGVNEGGKWVFRFVQSPGMSAYSQVTADWFGDMRNALKAIESELKKSINQN